MEPLTSAPETSAFVSLSVHQSRTPDSFHSGPAVLHYHATNCKLVGLEHDLSSTPALNTLRGAEVNGSNSSPENLQRNDANGGDGEPEKEVVIGGLDVWVTSDKFLLYKPSASTGFSVPYRSILLHAIQRLKVPAQDQPTEVQGLYMNITKPQSPASFPQESDEEETLALTLVPPTTPSSSSGDANANTDAEPESESQTQKLYDAVSACANLHPDPVEEEDEDSGAFASGLVFPGAAEGGLPPPVDGSSGWITADNMHEFFDEEGNWIGEGDVPGLPGLGEGLGPGAGTVREREEQGDEQGGADEDAGADADETKWRRTD